MQQRLALLSAAIKITWTAIERDLGNVAAHGLPAFDLLRVFPAPTVGVGQAAAHVVAAIPLKPAARVVRMNPALRLPDQERL